MRLDLNTGWLIGSSDIVNGVEASYDEMAKIKDWMTVDLPCDIRQPLIEYGIIKEPLTGMNCFDSEWIENKYWWFKKEFNIENKMLEEEKIELFMDGLDIGAEIFVNDRHIAYHPSAFYPFLMNIKSYLKHGNNQLTIRLSTGLERVDKEEIKKYTISTEEGRRPGRGDKRRAFLRKPQYSYGWDWCPKVSTCCISGNVFLESYKQAAVRNIHVWTSDLYMENNKNSTYRANVAISVEVENFHPFKTCESIVEIVIKFDGEIKAKTQRSVLLQSGINHIDSEVILIDAKPWWPNGMGEQNMYTAEAILASGNSTDINKSVSFGVRTLEIDKHKLSDETDKHKLSDETDKYKLSDETDKHKLSDETDKYKLSDETDKHKLSDNERYFAIKINGINTFCKGGNWIPSDSIYARVNEERYEELIKEAREANFNMLRIWGGGLYEREAFYKLCDKYGIMIWQDFMFACSEYPDDKEWFIKLVEKEFDYQAKRLRNHPSVVLFSGNNEIHWGFDEWHYSKESYGSIIYNYCAPLAVRKNCPEIPYWNSSPYGGEHPNGSDIGDRHHWHDCMMNPEMQKRITPEEYDKVTAKFISEYGYVGPLKKSSIERFLDGTPIDIEGEVWQHHNNTFEKETVLAGIKYHYMDIENISIEDYLLYAGICQGTMYGYSLETFRYKEFCSGGLFWMYNDCWGEIGWTIIDYYLIRKISYYFVKRAFAHVKFVMRQENNKIKVVGINESPAERKIPVQYGYVSFDGKINSIKKDVITIEPYSRKTVLNFKKGSFDERKGTYFVKAMNADMVNADESIPLAILRTNTFRELFTGNGKVNIVDVGYAEEYLDVTLECISYAHAIYFDLPDNVKLSDSYFDMLPGDKRTIRVYASADILRDKLKVKWVG